MPLKLIAAMMAVITLGACTPVMDPAQWDPTMYCKFVPQECKQQGSEDEMLCRTPDGYRFSTGQKETSENGWICTHIGMGEG